jgi:hypothetical protein
MDKTQTIAIMAALIYSIGYNHELSCRYSAQDAVDRAEAIYQETEFNLLYSAPAAERAGEVKRG